MGLIKNKSDQRYLKEAAQVAGHICNQLIAYTQVGVSTLAIEELGTQLLAQNRSTAPFKEFHGFGFATCVSVNHAIVNGLPRADQLIQPSDVVSIAIGTCIRGLYAKAARTCYVGNLDQAPEDVKRLLTGCRSLFDTLSQPDPPRFKTLNDLLNLVPQAAQRYQLHIVKQSGGYGIGHALHDWPQTPNQPDDLNETIPLLPGLAFTLMPMMCLGQSGVWHVGTDGWTQQTEYQTLAAHEAETCMVDSNGDVLLLSHV